MTEQVGTTQEQVGGGNIQTPPKKKDRKWVFTVNNYTMEHVEQVKLIESKYCVFGFEVAPTTGTKHLQGFIEFKNPRSFQGVQFMFPKGTYLDRAKSTDEAITYCKKEGDYHEQGIIPESQKKSQNLQLEAWHVIW